MLSSGVLEFALKPQHLFYKVYTGKCNQLIQKKNIRRFRTDVLSFYFKFRLIIGGFGFSAMVVKSRNKRLGNLLRMATFKVFALEHVNELSVFN